MSFEPTPIATVAAPSPLQRLRVPGWRWVAGLLAAGTSLAVAASAVDLPLLRAAARSAVTDPVPVVLAVAAYTLAFWLRAGAWRLLATTGIPVRTLHSVLQASLFANHVAPFKAGEVLRPALLAPPVDFPATIFRVACNRRPGPSPGGQPPVRRLP